MNERDEAVGLAALHRRRAQDTKNYTLFVSATCSTNVRDQLSRVWDLANPVTAPTVKQLELG